MPSASSISSSSPSPLGPGPPAPQLDLSWALLPPSRRRHVAAELTVREPLSPARPSGMPTMTVVFTAILLQGNPAAAPHPQPRSAGQPGKPASRGRRPRSPQTPPLGNGFPSSARTRGLPPEGSVLGPRESSGVAAVPGGPRLSSRPRRSPLPASVRAGAGLPRKDLTGHFRQLSPTRSAAGRRSQPPSEPASRTPLPAPCVRGRPPQPAAGDRAGVTGATARAGACVVTRATVPPAPGGGRGGGCAQTLSESNPRGRRGWAGGAEQQEESPPRREDSLPLFGSDSDRRGPAGSPPHLQVPLGVHCGKRRGEVGGGACLRLMDGTEEMSGTFFPRGGGEAAATSPPHSFAFLPACSGRA